MISKRHPWVTRMLTGFTKCFSQNVEELEEVSTEMTIKTRCEGTSSNVNSIRLVNESESKL